MAPRLACPLCGFDESNKHLDDGHRISFRCPRCHLIHSDPAGHLSIAAERERYELHQNDASDPGYVGFLRRLADPVIERLPRGACGLDFGCGPAPVLSGILSDAGFPCQSYDPFFAPRDELLQARYDFVTCSEVVEHSRNPAKTFETLRALLVPGGVLGVMTRFYPPTGFADWFYRRDPTHVCFYCEATMRWVADTHVLRVEFPEPNIAIFTAPM